MKSFSVYVLKYCKFLSRFSGESPVKFPTFSAYFQNSKVKFQKFEEILLQNCRYHSVLQVLEHP